MLSIARHIEQSDVKTTVFQWCHRHIC